MKRSKDQRNPTNIACIFMVTGVKDAKKKAALEDRVHELLDKLEQIEDVQVSYVARNPSGSLAVGLLVGEAPTLGGAQTAMLMPRG